MAADRLHVEVVYALPEKQRLIALDVPAGQVVHAAALERPVCALNVPAGHTPVHASTPSPEQPAPLNRPAGHGAQALQDVLLLLIPVQGQSTRLPTWYWPAPHPRSP